VSIRRANEIRGDYNFGSAWATLGLVRWVPPGLDLSARQKQGLEEIARFSGNLKWMRRVPTNRWCGWTFRHELDDDDLASWWPARRVSATHHPVVQVAQGYRRGFGAPEELPQLRRLTLENTAITDAGLGQLVTLTQLEVLNLKGTKITDAGGPGQFR